ncbi:MAG: pyruvate kinase [Haloarculaceae archaeon]
MTRNAKIVCTLGPASEDGETITALANAGMSVARLNASHGTTAQRRDLIELVRAVDERTDQPVATLLDLPGPEVRTATLDSPLSLADGDSVEFVEGEEATRDRIGLSRPIDEAAVDDIVLLDDGHIEATITAVADGVVTARIDSGGELKSRAGVNVPGVDLDLPTITEVDHQELDLAAEMNVDFVAASFVRSADDIYEISGELEARGADIPLIAKIERADAVDNIEDIIDAAYGVMVARGDLGVECPLEDVPIIQKRIVRQCHRAGVPVITATEMLDSMIHNRRPTRAEASDVANAVLDGTDAVMLSGETAVGDHPVRVVETMCRIIEDVEDSEEYDELLEQRVPPADGTKTGALARSARFLSRDVDAEAIVAASESGYTARKAAKYRPNIPIVAASPNDRVRRQLALSWGIIPKQAVHSGKSADAVIQGAVQAAIEAGAAESGDTVAVLSGMMTQLEGLDTANILKVHVASEMLASGRAVVSGYAAGPLYRVNGGSLDEIPEGAILAVPAEFDGEFTGEVSKLSGIVDEHEGVTSYAAIVARELGIPMVGSASIPDVADGTEVTIDGERGVVYAGPLEDADRQ